jgi:hypothetical protein
MMMLRPFPAIALLAAVAVLSVAAPVIAADEISAAADHPVTFRNDVMAVLSKAGCNAGACHGNRSGKGGFKLSLRGESPAADYDALTRDVYARRIDPLDPDRSLVLLKTTAQVAHEGGRRFGTDAPEYRILRSWIDAGAPRDDDATTPKLVKLEVSPGDRVLVDPEDRMKITATATFSDASKRDVSRMAVYEQSVQIADISADGQITRKKLGEAGIVVRYLNRQQVVRVAFVPARPTFAWSEPPASNFIDEQIFAKLRTLRTNPSELCSDESSPAGRTST